jgi:DNA-nicking Smr family endonuclease
MMEQSEKPVKYIYQIRSRNGVIVNNLQIYGHTEEEARQKLEQMYRNCEVLESGLAPVEHNGHFSCEDIMDIISKD